MLNHLGVACATIVILTMMGCGSYSAPDFWHGTHVAGIVAGADANDDLGTVGVAPLLE